MNVRIIKKILYFAYFFILISCSKESIWEIEIFNTQPEGGIKIDILEGGWIQYSFFSESSYPNSAISTEKIKKLTESGWILCELREWESFEEWRKNGDPYSYRQATAILSGSDQELIAFARVDNTPNQFNVILSYKHPIKKDIVECSG